MCMHAHAHAHVTCTCTCARTGHARAHAHTHERGSACTCACASACSCARTCQHRAQRQARLAIRDGKAFRALGCLDGGACRRRVGKGAQLEIALGVVRVVRGVCRSAQGGARPEIVRESCTCTCTCTCVRGKTRAAGSALDVETHMHMHAVHACTREVEQQALWAAASRHTCVP